MNHRPVLTALLLGLSVGASVFPPSAALAAPSQQCADRPDTPIHSDATIGRQILADVDGDSFRDVITQYWRGSESVLDADEVYLHVELAAGWGTALRMDAIPGVVAPVSATPVRLLSMAGRQLILVESHGTLVGPAFVFVSMADCALAPLELVGGGIPSIWMGIGPVRADWFSCRTDGVVQLELGVSGPGAPFYDVGTGTFYRLNPDGFRDTGQLPLDLPASRKEVEIGFPDCTRPSGTFVDDDSSVFQTSIEWLAVRAVTIGCNPPANDRFCPDQPVTRGQMAAFLVRAIGYTEGAGADHFIDDDTSIFESAIDRLHSAGVTQGCNPPANDRFCPDRPVSRAEMAAFLVRAIGYTEGAGADHFIDDDTSIFESAIDRLRSAGVTQGCNPPANDRFCPDDPVTRGQMAALLRRALDS